MHSLSLLFWILIAGGLLALVARFYGVNGVSAALTFAAVLLAKDTVRHFGGQIAEWVFVGIFSIPCITIFVLRRKKRAAQIEHNHRRKP